MMAILIVIHVFVTITLIGVVLIQRSEGGGLGIGSSQGMGAFMSGRGTANLLTRTTAVLAAIFLSLSLTMAVLNRSTSVAGNSLLGMPPTTSQTVPLPAAPPTHPAPSVPTAPAPSVPH
jgi:preprotein translocase subunit SecG